MMTGEVQMDLLGDELCQVLRDALKRGQGEYTPEQEQSLFQAFEMVVMGAMILDAIDEGFGVRFEGDQIVLVGPEPLQSPDGNGSAPQLWIPGQEG